MMRQLLIATILLIAAAAAFTIDTRSVDGEMAQQMVAPPLRHVDMEFIKRFLPAKERRAPLDGFEDMSGFLRTIDGIQKPRFG